MEIHMPELAAIMYMPKLPISLRPKIFTVANFFKEMLVQAERWTQRSFPKETWHYLVSHGAA